MITIRPATPEDLDALSEMGEHFFGYSAFSKFAPFDRNAARAAIARLASGGTLLAPSSSAVLVADQDGEIVGGIVGMVNPLWFNPSIRAATELAWWVAEEHRHGRAAIMLYRAFEQWAESMGTTIIVMSDLVIDGDTPAAGIFQKLGFTTVERAHVKAGGQ
jgi:predicted N-acetyltransferase YhbS